jgi:hypothetical protein
MARNGYHDIDRGQGRMPSDYPDKVASPESREAVPHHVLVGMRHPVLH